MNYQSDMPSGAYVDSSGVLRQRVAAQPSAAPAQGYAPQGYAPQSYAPQGYAPQGYAPLEGNRPVTVVRETTYNRYNDRDENFGAGMLTGLALCCCCEACLL